MDPKNKFFGRGAAPAESILRAPFFVRGDIMNYCKDCKFFNEVGSVCLRPHPVKWERTYICNRPAWFDKRPGPKGICGRCYHYVADPNGISDRDRGFCIKPRLTEAESTCDHWQWWAEDKWMNESLEQEIEHRKALSR